MSPGLESPPCSCVLQMATKALRLGPALKEVRLHLCQKSAASAGARQFVEEHYVPIKLANPK